ncbi:MAG: leucine-rich repeat domain-containing protein [Oscillospiraceae bacterium]|nr:leucine-rich repeat domain-containing protein [Oscillospiraceae bacterium]
MKIFNKFGEKKPFGEKVKYRNRDRVERAEFRGSELTELEMPDSIIVIGESAFRECRNLKTAHLSNSICEIGAYAFRDCDALENILMPGEMRCPDGAPGVIGIGCFEGCGLLREITIPEGVAVIGANAFHNCAALESVTLPRSLRAIRSGAFSGCARLKTLRYPVVPELIAADAFLHTPFEQEVAEKRQPVLTVMHKTSFSLPQIFQFAATTRLIGTEQTDGNMSIMLDAVEENRICFRITGYKHAGGRHVVPKNEPTLLFHEEYETGRAGMQKEDIYASYR